MPEFRETCDYECEMVVAPRNKDAMLVLIDDEKYWFPYSQICDSSEINKDSDKGEEGTITVSEWIAVQKGLE